jgi:hypothetical protein
MSNLRRILAEEGLTKISSQLPGGPGSTENPPPGSDYTLWAVDFRGGNPVKVLERTTPEKARGFVRKLNRLYDYWKNKYDTEAGEEYKEILGISGGMHPFSGGVDFVLVRGRGRNAEKWWDQQNEWYA